MKTKANNIMKPVEWLLLITLSILWGGSFFFSKMALEQLQPLTIVMGRVVLGALFLNLIVKASGQQMPKAGSTWRMFFIMGLLNNLIPFSLIFWGQTQIASGLASILNASTPVWTVILAHFFTSDEPLTKNKLLGVLLGVAGITTMIGWDALQGMGLNVLAQLAIVGATISYAFAGVYGKRFKGISPLVAAAGQVTCSAVMIVPFALMLDKPWIILDELTTKTIGSILGLALLSTTIAYLIYFRLLVSVGASNLLLVTFLIPISALFLSIVILGEYIAPRQFLGMGIIGLGLAAIDHRLFKKLSGIVFSKRVTARY